ENSMHVFLVVFCADSIQRLINAFREFFYHSQCYLPDHRVTTIICRTFSYDVKTICVAIGLIFTGLAHLGSVEKVTYFLSNSIPLLSYMPLYWIFYAVHLSYSPLDYARWIRDTHGLDYAAGMASNYFHGYLKLALPERNDDGLQKRMQDYEDTNSATFGLHRLIILIPDEMFVNGVIESSILEKAKDLETKFINRAGVNRPFKHAVYRLTKTVNGKTYYFAMEGATPMLSFFEAMNFELSATWQMKEMKREIWLKFCKHLKELLDTWPETRRKVELIMYN
ncbi:hypothetical protein KR222_005130, partial [Zaprionus bogoriensis]